MDEFTSNHLVNVLALSWNHFFVTEESGLRHLQASGIGNERIFFVGNTMIDSLVYALPKAEKSNILNP